MKSLKSITVREGNGGTTYPYARMKALLSQPLPPVKPQPSQKKEGSKCS